VTIRQTLATLCLAYVLAIGGCAATDHETSRKQAQIRWQDVRAGVTLQVAQQQYDKGQLEKARQTLQAALKTYNNDARLYLLLAKVMFELKQPGEAERQLEQARRVRPDLPQIDYWEGVLAQSASQWEQALAAYRSAYNKSPQSQTYLCALLEAELAAGHADEAGNLAVSRFADFPRSVRLRIAAADSFLVAGDFSRAERLYQQAIDLDPGNVEAREGLARSLYLAGKPHQAAKVLTSLIDNHLPDRTDLKYMLGNCHLAAGQYAAAVRVYQTCLVDGPAPEALLMNLARACLLNRQPTEACKYLQQLLQRDGGEEVQAWELLGHAYLQSDRPALAADAYAQAVRNGADPSALRPMLDLCTRLTSDGAKAARPPSLAAAENYRRQAPDGDAEP